MRKSTGALAYLIRNRDEHPELLAQWNEGWQSYSFVGGHKRNEESFRECVIREVNEELRIDEGSEFLVEPTALSHLEYTAWSVRARVATAYTMEVFRVTLVSTDIEAFVSRAAENCWVSFPEIWAGCTENGTHISNTVRDIVRHILAENKNINVETSGF